MVVRSLDEVKHAVDELAGIIQPPEDLLPTYGVSRDFGYPHIEIDGILMSYVTVDRGKEIERHSSKQFDPEIVKVFLAISERIWQELRSEIENQGTNRRWENVRHDRRAVGHSRA